MAVGCERLERGLQGPARALEPCHPFGRDLAQGYMGQDVQPPVAVSRGLIKHAPDTPTQVSAPLGIPHLPPLRGHVTGLEAAYGAPSTPYGTGQSRRLARDATGAPGVHRTQPGTGTDVPVLPPEVPRGHRLQPQPHQGAFLGMTILPGKDLAHPAVRGLINDQGLPW